MGEQMHNIANKFGLRPEIDIDLIVNGAIVTVIWNDRTETRILITNAWEIVRQRGTLEKYSVKGFDLNDMREREIPLSIIASYVGGPRETQERLRGVKSGE